MRKISCYLLLCFALFLFFGCPSEPNVVAEEPSILSVSEDLSVAPSEDFTLAVEAEVSDGGKLSFQWFYSINSEDAGELIEGATEKEFALNVTSSGYYYCVVTNTLGADSKSVESRRICVTVVESQYKEPDAKPSESELNDGQEKNPEPEAEPDKSSSDSKESVPESVIPSPNPQSSEKEQVIPVSQDKSGSIVFNFKDAEFIAEVEVENGSSRAASSISSGNKYIKVAKDGSTEDAIIIGEDCSLANIIDIHMVNTNGTKNTFVVLDENSVIGHETVEKKQTIPTPDGVDSISTYTSIVDIEAGELLLVNEDGQVIDILRRNDVKDDGSSESKMKRYYKIRQDSVTFDADGNCYFIVTSEYGDEGDMIYQYKIADNTLTEMIAAAKNTLYYKIVLDSSGEWIFANGSRTGNTFFLRAIPVNNPDSFVNIYYSSDYQVENHQWGYDENTERLFYVAYGRGLRYASKSKGFKDNVSVGMEFTDTLFESYETFTGTFVWTNSMKDSNDNFDGDKVVDYVLTYLSEHYDTSSGLNKVFTADEIDIKFDKYLTETGVLKQLADLTAGKKNKEAFEALNSNDGRGALYSVSRWIEDSFGYVYSNGRYRRNFLADIVYLKDTDTLLSDTEYASLIFGKDEDGTYPITMNDFASDVVYAYYDADWITMHNFSSKYYMNNNLKTDEIIDYLFSFCNVEGTKEFRLDYFKKDEAEHQIYYMIESDLKNQEAIEWIASDRERMDRLYAEFSDYRKLMNFISKTCYIAGTDQKAITWNYENTSDEPNVCYRGEHSDSLYVCNEGVFYVYTNLDYFLGYFKPYCYVVQVTDSTGKYLEYVNKIDFPNGKIARADHLDKRHLLLISLTDSNGFEIGSHNIFSIEMSGGNLVNWFDDIPNSDNLEVVSFNGDSSNLYFSCIRGTTIINGSINFDTHEYKPISIREKIVTVFSFNK